MHMEHALGLLQGVLNWPAVVGELRQCLCKIVCDCLPRRFSLEGDAQCMAALLLAYVS